MQNKSENKSFYRDVFTEGDNQKFSKNDTRNIQ